MSGFSFVGMLSNSISAVDSAKHCRPEVNNNNLPEYSNYYQQVQHKHQYEKKQNNVPNTQHVKEDAFKSEISKSDVNVNSSYRIERFIDQPKLEVQDPSVFQPQITSANCPQMYGGYYQGGYVPSYYYNHLAGVHTPWMGTHGQPQYDSQCYQQTVSDVTSSLQSVDHMARNDTIKSKETVSVVKTSDVAKCASSGKSRRRNRTCFSRHQMERLEELLEENRYPDVYRREEIARELDLEEDVIRVWFKNRRAKAKKVEKRGAAMCKPREESNEGSTQEGVKPGLSTWSHNAQSSNASNIPQNVPGLHPVFDDAGMTMVKKGDLEALIPAGLGEGIQYMTKPSEYYGDFNRDVSLSDSSASSVSLT